MTNPREHQLPNDVPSRRLRWLGMNAWSKLPMVAAAGAVFACNALLGNGEHDLASDASVDAPDDAGDDGSAGSGAAQGASSGSGSGTTSGATPVTTSGSTSGTSSGSTGTSSGASGTSSGSSNDSGMPPPFASCAPGGDGMANCSGGPASCCTSLPVTGGTFDRTYTPQGDAGPTGEADPATVSSFRLDKYEVTIGRFRQFVKAWNGGAGYLPPAGSGKHTHLKGGLGLANTSGGYETGWNPSDDSNVAPTDANLRCESEALWTSSPDGEETLPINCVNWFEAYAFCIWDGGFLPSEAEWEYAAAGGSLLRTYPWGADFPNSQNVGYAVLGCNYPFDSPCCDGNNIAPVGTTTMGAGLWGQLDLEGNVQEWTLDAELPYVDPCVDCSALQAASNRSIRGGDYESGAISNPTRAGFQSAVRSSKLGIRCARTP